MWLVDPVARTLEVLRLEGASWLMVAPIMGDERVRAESFAEVELALAALWIEG